MPRLILLFAILLLISSCVGVPNARTRQPSIVSEHATWIRYLPETSTEGQFRLGVRPVPMDNGWTDLRMQRDLTRIAELGIQVIMVEVAPQRLLAEEFLPRFRKFGEIASDHGLRIVLSLVPESGNAPAALERGNLVRYLAGLRLPEIPAYFCEQCATRPVVLIAEDFALADALADEAVTLLRFGKELPPCPKTPLENLLPKAAAKQWCRAALWTPENGWILKRRRGDSMKKQLRFLRQSDFRILLLSSWNDYSDGSFLEPNSLDGDAMTQILQKY